MTVTIRNTVTDRLAAIRAATQRPTGMNVNELFAVVHDDVPWLLAEVERLSAANNALTTLVQELELANGCRVTISTDGRARLIGPDGQEITS